MHRLRDVVAWLRADEGSALVEFVVSMPLLAIMVMAGSGTLMVIQARFAVAAAAREAALTGANVSTSIDPYDTAVGAAQTTAIEVLLDSGLDPLQATISFAGTTPDVARGGIFRVEIEYGISLPVPAAHYLGRAASDGTIFSVRAVSVAPIQQYKARWPCPSPDPLCS